MSMGGILGALLLLWRDLMIGTVEDMRMKNHACFAYLAFGVEMRYLSGYLLGN